MDSENSSILPTGPNDEDLEMYAYLQSSKRLIEREGGHGRVEFKFQNDGQGMRLGTKTYSITNRAYKHKRPSKRYGLYNGVAVSQPQD
jgi:hypothetical protein